MGRVADAALGSLYRQAAMFVLPSPDEGLGLVFLEAMSAGTPCVAARGAAEEIITDGVHGFIVDPEDAGMVSERIVRLFRDEPARTRMGSAAARHARERYSEAPFAARAAEWLDLQPVPVAC
jgi:glycosyltransferase involved in cell wall biosynthesis